MKSFLRQYTEYLGVHDVYRATREALDIIRSRRQVLQSLLGMACTAVALSIPPLFQHEPERYPSPAIVPWDEIVSALQPIK